MEIYQNRIFQQGVEAVKKGYGEEALKLFSVLYNTYPFEESVIIYLGYSYYLLNDLKRAIKIWEKLDNLSTDKIYINLLLAFAYAKIENIEQAIEYWLDILKIDPKNKKAKNMLELLKRSKSNKYFSKMINFKNAVGYLPYSKRLEIKYFFQNKKIKKYFIIGGIFIAIFLIIISMYSYYFSVYNIFSKKDNLESINTNYLPLEKKIEKEKTYIIYNNEKEIEKDFNYIKYYITIKNYNGVLYFVNKINNSNAKYITKEKAKKYLAFIEEPSYYDNFTIPTFDEITKSPYLYLNCFVKWKGIINNLDKSKNNFKLLVYEKSDIYIKGIINCYIDNSSFLFNNIKVEIFAKFISFDENSLNFDIKFIRILDK
ncbi:MAG: hypothetical protein N3A58_01210 [Spirochaetes bacterium]|nr:hypothetical protein [Spirochaetota bacterium]